MKEVEIAYQAALDYLYSFVDYSLTHSANYAQAKFDLGRMVAFLSLLGDPHQQYPVIHIAGTKGKGSTAALIASVLATAASPQAGPVPPLNAAASPQAGPLPPLDAAGYRVGLYTSPHLEEYTERIQVNGQPIAPGELVDLVNTIKPMVAQVERLTTFEITTALAFLYFSRQKVDVAVVEVGLGGRLDATNVVDPLVSVITSLSMDHMAVLGDTLEKIAAEKAGIIKPGRPVVMSPQRDEARQVIEQVAAERGCPLVAVGKNYLFRPGAHSLQGQTFQVWKAGGQQGAKPGTFFIPLLGLHQVENAATAYAALQVVREQAETKFPRLRLTEADIRKGFAGVSWPARFELLRADPPVIVDSAHNPDSALRLRQTIDDYLPDRKVILIFGASDDKDIEGMFAELLLSGRYASQVSRVIATQSIHPRAAKAGRLAEIAGKSGVPAEAVVPVEKALAAALKAAAEESGPGKPPAVILAAGSLFVAAAVREIWKKQEAVFEV